MSEPEDDTPESADTPRPLAPQKPPGSYYYDDGTGYEIYPPDDAEPDDAPAPPPTGRQPRHEQRTQRLSRRALRYNRRKTFNAAFTFEEL